MLTISMYPIDTLKPYTNNPRDNSAAIQAVANSIQEFGFRQPIVVDADFVIVCGHTRYLAAQQLGLTEVPVHQATDLSPEQAKAYRLADNKTNELAEWDLELLPIELQDLQDADFDLVDFGFAADDLAQLLDPGVVDGATDPDDVPSPAETGRTQRGDLWALGDHRLICGDSCEPASYAALLGDDDADLLLTDPPYNVAYEGGTDAHLTIANDNMDTDQYRSFLTQALGAAATRLAPGRAFYIWHADTYGGIVRSTCDAVDLPVRQCLIWKKNTLVLGRQDYQWIHEPCLYGWKPGAAHRWLGDRAQTTVFECNKPQRNAEHPTMKPVELLLPMIQNSSQTGDQVLDPFGGSGSTLIACEQTGRHARLIELDPTYCDVIIARWEAFTGQTAEKITPTTANENHHQATDDADAGGDALC